MTRTACVIAVAKARDTFEPYLHQVILPYISIALVSSIILSSNNLRILSNVSNLLGV